MDRERWRYIERTPRPMDQTSVFHGTTSNPPMAKAKLNWGGGCCCKNDSKWHEVLQFFNSIRHLAEAQPPTTEMARDQLIGFSFFVDALPTAPSSILSRRERAFHYGGRRYTRPDGPEMGGIDNRENQHHLNGFSFFFVLTKFLPILSVGFLELGTKTEFRSSNSNKKPIFF